MSGRINLIEIDLLQFAGSVLSSLGAGAGIAGALDVLSYFIEIWLTLTLDIEFNMQTLAQINWPMTYQHCSNQLILMLKETCRFKPARFQ